MAKRIVFCADGTWLAPRNGTNVYRLYKALTVTADQVTQYDDGVGADANGCAKLHAGAFGDGLLQKVIDGYTWIAHVYEPGDEIFLFGFSRGAYTARSIAGFIAACGLPTGAPDDTCVARAFDAYRDPANRAAKLAQLGACGLQQPVIRMIGVWETVGSLGIPALFGGIDEAKYGFLDTSLSPAVKNAFHAIAVDEQRCQFPATLWTSPPAPGQTLEQVWFTGCHEDVGGGTPLGGGVDAATRLCDIPLGWMIAKAQALGLTMNPAVAAQYGELPAPFALDKYTDTWAAAPIGPPHRRPIAPNAEVANSVALRIQYGLGDYAPSNLTITDGALADSYALVDLVDENAF